MVKKVISPIDDHKGQFLYLDRWVDKKTFRAFVYDKDQNQKLASSYDEFKLMVDSGTWFATRPETSKRSKKDAVCANS